MNEIIFATVTIGVFLGITIMGTVATLALPAIETRRRNYFIIFYALVSLFIIISIGEFFTYEKPKYILLEKIITYLEYLIPSVLFVVMTSHLLYNCGKETKKNAFFRIVLALWCVFFVLLQIAQFTDSMYYISPKSTFVRGPLHFLLVLPITLNMTLNIVVLFYYRKTLSKKKFIHFIFYLFPIELALIVQPFFDIMVFVIIATIICATTLYGVILSEQINQYTYQQKEILNQRAKITVLQMRPHFIYNTMTSIYYLCEQNPKKAQQLTLNFTNYLRKIFKAVVSEKVIPFSEELEHTYAYVNVAIAQIGDSLSVDYDTPHISFYLPPLTLQPIVENAIKHGLNFDDKALSISVMTRKTEEGSVITVKDNGVGFNPESIDPKSTLLNIRERLKNYVDGTLDIKSSRDGTTVTIFLPDKSQLYVEL